MLQIISVEVMVDGARCTLSGVFEMVQTGVLDF